MTPAPLQPQEPPGDEEKPPFFGNWKGMYTAVLAYLAALILLLYLFTKIFS
ncbi:MAG TPA: hypothetical protein VI932_13055 [Bacteroidota bacterium]|nr:hypothetical protein [Bacteroidota bacterium]